MLHFTSANVNKANWATNMPTNVLSRNTWGRNDCRKPLPPVIPLFVGPLLVLLELGGGVAFLAPAFGVGDGLDVVGRI